MMMTWELIRGGVKATQLPHHQCYKVQICALINAVKIYTEISIIRKGQILLLATKMFDQLIFKANFESRTILTPAVSQKLMTDRQTSFPYIAHISVPK